MKKIYITFLLVLGLTACQKGNITPDELVASEYMTFNILSPGHQTKVAAGSFEQSDVIGLYVTDYVDDLTPMPLQVSGNRANNIPVTFDGSAWIPGKTIYWGAGKSDVYAYYPYFEQVQDVESQYFEVATDQTGEGYASSDLLWAKAGSVKQSDGAVNLQMNHLMSKLTVKIVAGEDYIGSLPDDASIRLHNTVIGARVDISKGAVSKDLHSSAQSINMKELGLRTYEGVEAVVFEAVVVPQMLESTVPLIEINSKSVSYLIEDYFNFRSGMSYVYTVTLNSSTTAIKVEIGCELEDWNSAGGSDSGDGGAGDGGSGEGEEDGKNYTDLSAAGTANCYLIQGAGDYKFKSVIGNTDATVGNVKSVEVLWESFGTDERPNVGDLIASVSYKDGYIRFSTPENFRNGNAAIAAKNSKGTILWSWHIWCAEEGWKEQVYYNDAGTMMDRNLGATSAIPGDVSTIGLLYQWGRKDPFLGKSLMHGFVVSSGTWEQASGGSLINADSNPMTFYDSLYSPNGSWKATKTVYDPCPEGWRVPDGGNNGVWLRALGDNQNLPFDASYRGMNLGKLLGEADTIWYPEAFTRDGGGDFNMLCVSCWTCSSYDAIISFAIIALENSLKSQKYAKDFGFPVRCQKDE